MRLHVLIASAAMAALFATSPAAQRAAGLDRVLANQFGLTDAEQRTLAAGLEAVRTLPATAPDGLAAIGAIEINARPSVYLDWAASYADFERGSSVQAVRKMEDPPSLADLSQLTLSPEELAELRRCRIGACTVQLDADSIRQIAAIDWRQPDANERATAVVRLFMLNIALEYRLRGNAGLPHYDDAKRATDVHSNAAGLLAEEAASGRLPAAVIGFLAGYPATPLPDGAVSYFAWMTNTFGLKPTTRLNHTVIYRPRSNGLIGVIATKQLYATHYFHGALETRYIVGNPALDDRFVLVMVTRTRSDGLTGLSGAIMGGTIRRRATHSLRTYLRYTKQMVETRQRHGWSAPR